VAGTGPKWAELETTEVTIRRLREDEVDQAASMLARAFVGDPFPALLADDPAARLEASRWAFTVFAREY
jgi:hypothetical protein